MKVCAGDSVVVRERICRIVGMDEGIKTIWKYIGYYVHHVSLKLVAYFYLKYFLLLLIFTIC